MQNNIDSLVNTIIQGNVLSVLKTFPPDSVNCIITSPPYYGLRSYNTEPQIWGGNPLCKHDWNTFIKNGISGSTKSKKVRTKGEENFQIVPSMKQSVCSICGAWLGELGQEPTHTMFIEHLTEIFMECARVLKPDGTMWINISDSYSGSNQGNGAPPSGKNATNRGTSKMQLEGHKSILAKSNLAKKSLMGIPDRLKISLIDNGLVCRNEIVWSRPNQMPQSVKDRFTNDFEKVYFFTKSNKYYFEQQLEDFVSKSNSSPRNRRAEGKYGSKSVFSGKPLFSDGKRDFYNKGKRNKRTTWIINTEPQRDLHFATYPKALIKTPILAGCPEGGIVLDPFFGSGTTGIVAKENNRNWIGIELNPEYIEIAKKRLEIK